MALSVFKTYSAGEVLTASDLNSSISTIHDNALALISPLTGNLDANTNAIFFESMSVPSTAIDNFAFYARDIGGVPRPFMRYESDGLQKQLVDSADLMLERAIF